MKTKSILNHELLKEEITLNPFTKKLKSLCIKNGSVLVKMRNDRWVEVKYQAKEEDEDDEHFYIYSKSFDQIWQLNGESLTSMDFDLIEFKSE